MAAEQRILTTHAGSLPRPSALADLHGRRSRGEVVDEAALATSVAEATRSVIEAQVAAGIDIGNDGEQARESFVTYVAHRMTGFGGTSQRAMMRDLDEHPDFVEHAEVADRIERAVEAVGDAARVIAGTDCGFDTTAGIGDVAPSLVWAKLRSLREGADLASARIF